MLHTFAEKHSAGSFDPLLTVSEIDHRIANNLALISSLVRMRATSAASAGDAITGPQAVELLRETAAQIEAVAHLHRQLSHGPGDGAVNVCEFLRDVCKTLEANAGDVALKQTYEAECILPRNRALPIALIVSEVVTNAAKYAHPAGIAGEIRLHAAAPDNGRLTVVIEDDGVGFPDGFDPKIHGGLGLRVVRALTRQLGAEHSFESGPLGVRFTLSAPLSSTCR